MRVSFRSWYIIFMVVVHAVIVFLSYRLLKDSKLLFILSELFLLASVYVAVLIYRQFRKPADFVSSGIEAIRDKDFTVKFVPTQNREVDRLIEVYNLMIDQLRQERIKQMEGQFFLEKLVEASPIAILIFDLDGRISGLNSRAASLLGLPAERVKGKTPAETGHPLLDGLTGWVGDESRTVKVNGIQTYKVSRSHFMDRGFRRSFLMIEELTTEILETEKKAYGKVIRMMAHEVNNSIGAINSILDVTVSGLPETGYGDYRHALQVAMDRNNRLSLFMRRFADVVRLPVPHRVATDLNGLVRDIVQLMQVQAEAKGVRLQHHLSGKPVIRPVDVAQMEQMLVNVVKNAIEACPAGGEVRVVLEHDRLVVRDNGQPIPHEVAANLFNPFFSTKADGQGIGLTLTREILHNHGFPFSLRTNPDGWTEFEIGIVPSPARVG
jgi:nitrogen fixation/metabolism regulation signal transduction histidine kinase